MASLRELERRWTNHVINPVFAALLRRGLCPPTYALVETTGRKSGLPRVVPVANGLDGDTFWLLAGLGDRASYVRNIRANPRVRVLARPGRLRHGLRVRWRTGTAVPLPDDDALARHRQLGRGRPVYRLDGILLRRLAAGSRILTIRIDLDLGAVIAWGPAQPCVVPSFRGLAGERPEDELDDSTSTVLIRPWLRKLGCRDLQGSS